MNLIRSFFLLLILSTVANAQVTNYEVGDVVDDFTAKDIFGVTHNLYSHTSQGRYVYIEFSTTSCGPCQDVLPIFNEFYDKYGCNEGDIACFAIFGTSYDDDETVEWFENTYGGSFHHAPAISNDGGGGLVLDNFYPTYFPTMCFIDSDNVMLDVNIFPLTSVSDIEAVFPPGFNPQPMNCTIGIGETESLHNYTVFPNPVKQGEKLHLKLFENTSEIQINIYNLLGEKVYSGTELSFTPDFMSGTYLLKINITGIEIIKKLIVL